MKSINRITLRGEITTPKFVKLEDDLAIRLTLATENIRTTPKGVTYAEVEHHTIIAFQSDVNINLESIEKGQILEIEGRLRYTKYLSMEGTERVFAEIRATEIKRIKEE